MKNFIKNLSPFNNRTEMPTAMLIIKKLLAFMLCFVVGSLLGNAVVIGAMIIGGKNFTQGETFSDSTMELLGLYAMAGMIAASVLYWKLIEKRKLSEMSVTRNIGGWLVGALIGFGLLTVCIAAVMLTGGISFEGLSSNTNISMLMLMLGGYAVQSSAEEFLCRGIVLCSLKDKVPMPVAIAVSTFVFTFNHWGNFIGCEPKYIFSGVLCLIVISCVFSFLTLRTGNIWTACGLHTIWNFCLSCILGLNLSGEKASTALINMKNIGENLLNGGNYGIEASIIADIVIAAAALLLWQTYKKNNTEREA